jgi:hypothetical protein
MQNFQNEQPVIYPFGPPVYLDQVPEEFIKELDNLIEENGGKVEFDASGLLAGRIAKQTELQTLISPELEQHIIHHCMRFNEECFGRRELGGDMSRTPSMIMKAIWSNIQEAREYNPPHQHTGHFSFVVYCRNDLEKYSIEELQDNPYDTPHGDNKEVTPNPQMNSKLAGLIELQYGEPQWMNWNQYQFIPRRGDIIIFPSWLRHTVYAHYEENCVRVSVAGNVEIVG